MPKLKGSLCNDRGIWIVRFRIYVDGKKKQKAVSTGLRVANNKREAEEKMAEILKGWEEKLSLTNQGEEMLLNYIKRWIDSKKTASETDDISSTTADNYVSIYQAHLEPYFAPLKLKLIDVKPKHIEDYITHKQREGKISNTTINKHISLLGTILRHAMLNDYIQSNPVERITNKPKKIKPQQKHLEADDLLTYLKAVKGTKMEVPVTLAVMFGLRRGEIVGLTWRHFDFNKKIMCISQVVKRKKDSNGQWVDVVSLNTKTDASASTYDLDDVAITYFRRIKNQQNALNPIWVCIDNETGERLHLDYITATHRKLIKKTSLEQIRFHDLRHSCLTLLANDPQFSMKQVQAYARHAQFSTTADTYSHINDGTKLRELQTITNALSDFLVLEESNPEQNENITEHPKEEEVDDNGDPGRYSKATHPP